MVAIHILVLLVLLTFDCLVAHPTIYPHVAMKRGNNYRERAVPYPPPGIISYHIHITYTLFNPPVCMLYILKPNIFLYCYFRSWRKQWAFVISHVNIFGITLVRIVQGDTIMDIYAWSTIMISVATEFLYDVLVHDRIFCSSFRKYNADWWAFRQWRVVYIRSAWLLSSRHSLASTKQR